MKPIIVFALCSSLLLQACMPIAIGGAVTTAQVIHDRRSTGTVIDDKTLELNIASKIRSYPRFAENSHVNVNVYDGLVLLTGEVINQQIKREIGAMVAQQKGLGVQHLANYLLIGPRSTLSNRSYDVKLTTKAKAVLMDVNIAGFDPTRVKVVAEHASIFLMGIVTEQESRAVVDVVRRVEGVGQVITLFTISN